MPLFQYFFRESRKGSMWFTCGKKKTEQLSLTSIHILAVGSQIVGIYIGQLCVFTRIASWLKSKWWAIGLPWTWRWQVLPGTKRRVYTWKLEGTGTHHSPFCPWNPMVIISHHCIAKIRSSIICWWRQLKYPSTLKKPMNSQTPKSSQKDPESMMGLEIFGIFRPELWGFYIYCPPWN